MADGGGGDADVDGEGGDDVFSSNHSCLSKPTDGKLRGVCLSIAKLWCRPCAMIQDSTPATLHPIAMHTDGKNGKVTKPRAETPHGKLGGELARQFMDYGPSPWP